MFLSSQSRIKIGIFLLLFSFNLQAKQSIDYDHRVTYLGSENPNCLDVSTTISGNSFGQLSIRVPQYFHQYLFQAKQGEVSYTKKSDQVFVVTTRPDTDVMVTYRACLRAPYKDTQKPIIEKDFFHVLAHNFFVFPENSNEIKTVRYQFDNFPQNFSFATSYHINKRKFVVIDKVNNLRQAVMAGGAFKIAIQKINNQPVHFILHGQWKMFSNHELQKSISKLIYQQRKLLNDDDFPHFVVIIIQDKPEDGSNGLTGSLYGNVLSMAITDADIKHKPLFLGSLSHELFHAWLGNKITIPLPQGNLQWFFEGVNDFYGWQLALDSGVASIQDYQKYYNKLLKEYTLSPLKNASNAELASIFQLRNLSGRMALVRGHLVFAEISYQLKKQSRSRSDLDAAIREILVNYNEGKPVSETELMAIFSRHVGEKIWDRAKSSILLGNPVVFTTDFFTKNHMLKTVEIDVPAFGFDLKSIVVDKKIRSLDPNSEAYRAGLREGDQVVEYGFDLTTPKQKAYILKELSAPNKSIQYTPETTKKQVPQYS